MELKQAIIIRNDLKLSVGKIISQACHASLGAYKKTEEQIKKKWEASGSRKIVLIVNNEKELLKIAEICRKIKVPSYLVRDAGRTEVPLGTITALGIGPYYEKEIDKITGALKLL